VRPFHLRASVFTLLEEGKLTSVVGRLAQIMLISLIIANVVAVALETIPSICARWHVFFGDFEKFSVGGYTVEYIIRCGRRSKTRASTARTPIATCSQCDWST
jgi:hypothetical protein